MCLYVHECALLERWVHFLCYVSCISFFLPIQLEASVVNPIHLKNKDRFPFENKEAYALLLYRT